MASTEFPTLARKEKERKRKEKKTFHCLPHLAKRVLKSFAEVGIQDTVPPTQTVLAEGGRASWASLWVCWLGEKQGP